MPRLSTAFIAVAVLGVSSFGVGSAAPVDQTMNLGNQVSSASVLPPSNVNAALSPNGLLFCNAHITWTASSSGSVTAYEIRRVIASTGIVTGGPWSVAGTVLAYSDNNVPLAVPVNTAAWQVRALVGTWSSDWAVATVDNPVLCLIDLALRSAAVPADQPADDLPLDEDPPAELPSDEVVPDDVLVDEVVPDEVVAGAVVPDGTLVVADD